MPFIGKSGSDAIFGALHHVCKVLARYQTKALAAVDQALSDGVITSEQATTARAFINTANATCDIFRLISQNSGFGPG
jgi:hypothetical protein